MPPQLDRPARLRLLLERDGATCMWCGRALEVEWLEECLRRGWDADEHRLRRALTALAGAIDRTGGQRRARPYLDAQLRRLRRRGSGATASA